MEPSFREAGPADAGAIVALIAAENAWIRTQVPFDMTEREGRMALALLGSHPDDERACPACHPERSRGTAAIIMIEAIDLVTSEAEWPPQSRRSR